MLNFGLALAAVCATEAILIFEGPVEDPLLKCLLPAVGLLYCATGFFLSRRRPLNRTGGLVTFGGVTWLLAGLAETGIEPLIAIGQISRVLPVVVTLHLLFVFPSGVTQSKVDRFAVSVLYFAATVLYLPSYLFESHPPPYDVLFVSEQTGIAEVSALARSVITTLVSLAIILNLLRRYRRTSRPLQHAYRPFVVYSALALVVTPLAAHLLAHFVGLSDTAFRSIFITALAGMPIFIIVAARRGGFAAVSPLPDLAGRLGEKEWGADLEATLGAAIGDPTLRIGFRMVDGEFITDSARPFARPDSAAKSPAHSADSRGEHEIRVGDRSLGIIEYDASLASSVEVRAAASVAAAWIEQSRLSAALQVTENELRSSYRQVMESTDSERRRIAQDLHDGLASRLLLLAIKVQAVGADSERGDGAGESPQGDAGLRRQVAELKGEIEQAIAELRVLVHDLMPADLVELGLRAALRRLVAEAPVTGELEAPTELDPLPAEVERSVYLIAAEAIANVSRHADADSLRVVLKQEVAKSGEGQISLAVIDDGCGGAAKGDGAGLSGIALRAASHGGDFVLRSPSGAGTRVQVTLPYNAATAADRPASRRSTAVDQTVAPR